MAGRLARPSVPGVNALTAADWIEYSRHRWCRDDGQGPSGMRLLWAPCGWYLVQPATGNAVVQWMEELRIR